MPVSSDCLERGTGIPNSTAPRLGLDPIGVGDVEHAELRRLHRYWLSKCGTRPRPARSDIDPTEIPQLLPIVMLVDVSDLGRKFRFRLVGTKVAKGMDPTGQFLHDAAPKGLYGHHINALYIQAARADRPFYSEFEYDSPNRGGPRIIRRLFLPLSETGQTLSMLLIGQVAESPVGIERSAWQLAPERFKARRLFFVEADSPLG